MFFAVSLSSAAVALPRRQKGAARARRPATAKCDLHAAGKPKSDVADVVVNNLFASRRNALAAMTLAPALLLNVDVASAAKVPVTPEERFVPVPITRSSLHSNPAPRSRQTIAFLAIKLDEKYPLFFHVGHG